MLLLHCNAVRIISRFHVWLKLGREGRGLNFKKPSKTSFLQTTAIHRNIFVLLGNLESRKAFQTTPTTNFYSHYHHIPHTQLHCMLPAIIVNGHGTITQYVHSITQCALFRKLGNHEMLLSTSFPCPSF